VQIGKQKGKKEKKGAGGASGSATQTTVVSKNQNGAGGDRV
jgi:hypothetical protein